MTTQAYRGRKGYMPKQVNDSLDDDLDDELDDEEEIDDLDDELDDEEEIDDFDDEELEDDEDVTDEEEDDLEEEDEDDSEVKEDSEKKEEIKEDEPKTKEETKTSTKEEDDFHKKSAYEKSKRLEREKREREEAERKAYNKGIMEANNGINPFTNEKMEDDFDIQVFKDMQEMKAKGLDPLDVKQFAKFQAQKTRESKTKEIEQENEAKKREEKASKDIQDFISSYPDVKIKELFENKKFLLFSDGKLGEKSLSQVYEDFKEYEVSVNEVVKKEVKKAIALKETTPGSVKDYGSDDGYFTLEEIDNMSDKQIRRNLRKIERSIDHWNK